MLPTLNGDLITRDEGVFEILPRDAKDFVSNAPSRDKQTGTMYTGEKTSKVSI